MRVKTPWIDALTQSREAARNSKEGIEAAPLVKPDLTPKKMSDSHFSAVLSGSVLDFRFQITYQRRLDSSFSAG